ncbi:SIMPL domain-containing protein [bacterium]|nr:SIMPL domain-containing protein [bacterium]
MNTQRISSRHGLMWLGTSLAVGLIISTVLAMGTVERIKLANQTIMVKGCAEKLIDSDVIAWSASFSVQGSQTADAYKKLKKDLSTVLDYLRKGGVPEEVMTVSSISTRELYERDEQGRRTDIIRGYRLSQSVHVRSSELEKISRISRECTDLIEKGIEIDSSTPRYFYTGFDKLKLEMLGEAARDARRRAEQLAKDSGSKVGALRSTSQGVFQITSADSTEVSNYGVFDTSSWTKKIRAVVTVRYSIR